VRVRYIVNIPGIVVGLKVNEVVPVAVTKGRTGETWSVTGHPSGSEDKGRAYERLLPRSRVWGLSGLVKYGGWFGTFIVKEY